MLPHPAILIAFIVAMIGVGAWQRHDGRTVERAAWEARESEQLRQANAAIVSLNDQARAAERMHADHIAAIATTYQKEIDHANAQRARDRAAVADGLRLRDPDSARLGANQCGPAAPGASASQRDGGAAGDLSAAATGFLLDLTNEADDVARQLATCQRIVRSDRRTP